MSESVKPRTEEGARRDEDPPRPHGDPLRELVPGHEPRTGSGGRDQTERESGGERGTEIPPGK